jgi:hypothetical protein
VIKSNTIYHKIEATVLQSYKSKMDVKEAGRRGGLAGGKKGGTIGGKARAAKMTPEQRSEAARKAVMARWAKAKTKKRPKPKK